MSDLSSRDGAEDRTVPPDTEPQWDDIAATALAAVRDVTAEIVRLVRSAATQATDGWPLLPLARSLLPAVERVIEERTVLGRDARTLRTRITELEERVHELEALLVAREAGWQAERTAFEDDVARERERGETLAQDLEQRCADVAHLDGRARRLREQMESAATRADADREKTLRLAREMVHSAEEARFALVGELETLRATLAAEQARTTEIQHERTRATQGAAELEAELAHARHTLEQLEASRGAAAAELTRARATLVHTEGELLAVQHDHQLSQVQLEKLCAAHDEMVEDQAQLVAKLHDAQTREARLRLRITTLEERLQALRDGAAAPVESPADAIDAVVQAATAPLTAELARTQASVQALQGELATTKAAASAATVRAETLQAEVHALERARAEAVLERDTTPAADASPVSQETSAAETLTADPVATEPVEKTADPEPVAEEPPLVANRSIAVLDGTGVWDESGGVVPCTGASACQRLRELAPACCLVDLGAPGALETVTTLRQAHIAIPLSGFAAVGDGVVAVGRFDVIPRPVDPDRVRAQVAVIAPPTGSVIMVGSDSAVLLPLRQGFQQHEMSVRTAWNVEQAASLARAVEPDAVTIDLGTATTGAADLIAELAQRSRPPAIFVIPGSPRQTEELAAALAARGPVIDRTDWLRAVADSLER